VSCPDLLAISVMQLKYLFNANAGVTNMLAVISANATIMIIIFRDVWSTSLSLINMLSSL